MGKEGRGEGREDVLGGMWVAGWGIGEGSWNERREVWVAGVYLPLRWSTPAQVGQGLIWFCSVVLRATTFAPNQVSKALPLADSSWGTPSTLRTRWVHAVLCGCPTVVLHCPACVATPCLAVGAPCVCTCSNSDMNRYIRFPNAIAQINPYLTSASKLPPQVYPFCPFLLQ